MTPGEPLRDLPPADEALREFAIIHGALMSRHETSLALLRRCREFFPTEWSLAKQIDALLAQEFARRALISGSDGEILVRFDE